MKNKVVILTGETQTGKTTFLQKWCEGKSDITGLLSPLKDGKRYFLNIQTGQYINTEAVSGEENILTVGKYQFSGDAFNEANKILMKDCDKCSVCKYLVIDEIGPLEVFQKKGLYNALIKILQKPFSFILIVVVRLTLVDEVIHLINKYETDIDIISLKELENAGTTNVSSKLISK